MNKPNKNIICQNNFPAQIKIKNFDRHAYLKTLSLIRERNLNTVCLEANCPNRYECFARGTATFMILGDVCTRNCRYCNIKKGRPKPIDIEEPKRIANAVKKMRLDYAVITCVSRDDLPDGGADQFVKTIKAIKKSSPNCKIEVLISDLQGNWTALQKIIKSEPDVINHNIEAVKDIFTLVRPKGDYGLSLELLKKIKKFAPGIKTKSGFMLGLGENDKQITETLNDLKRCSCDIVTIGQYLQPSPEHFAIKKYYNPKDFKRIERIAKKIGIEHIFAGSLVRSSYQANTMGE